MHGSAGVAVGTYRTGSGQAGPAHDTTEACSDWRQLACSGRGDETVDLLSLLATRTGLASGTDCNVMHSLAVWFSTSPTPPLDNIPLDLTPRETRHVPFLRGRDPHLSPLSRHGFAGSGGQMK